MALTDRDWRIVRSAPLFADFTDDEVRTLINGNGVRAFAKDQAVYQMGSESDAFFIVLNGSVKLSRPTIDGAEAITGIFKTGATFAECDTFQGFGYTTDCITLAPSRILRVETARLRTVISDNPEVAFLMMASASRYVKDLVEQIELMKVQSVIRRAADYLLSITPDHEANSRVTLPYEKGLIANRLGMSPETFSRALATLRDAGVTVDRSEITIGDRNALICYATTGKLTRTGQCPEVG